MIAVRIGPDWRFTVVGAPAYFERRDAPETPQELTNHTCINMRLTTAGGIYAWEFKKGDRELAVRVDGQLTFNSVIPVLNAALDGHGLAYVPEDLAKPYLEDGRLKEVLADWCPYLQGYYSTTQIAGNPHRLFPCWWMRCAIVRSETSALAISATFSAQKLSHTNKDIRVLSFILSGAPNVTIPGNKSWAPNHLRLGGVVEDWAQGKVWPVLHSDLCRYFSAAANRR